jgi:uncharacterized protein (DUF58 family)
MKFSRQNNHGLRIRPGGNFWGLAALAVFLFFSRWLFDELFFLNTLYVIIIYLVMAFIYALFVLDHISIERKFRNRRWHVSDRFDEEITVTNRSILPVFWMEICDKSGIRRKPYHHIAGVFKRHGKHTFQSTSILERRGKVMLGPIEISTSDPMACFTVSKPVPMNGAIIVRPYRVDLATGKIRKMDTESGRMARFTLQHSDIISSSVRPYMEGDPLNRIHWATTARRGKIHSRHQDLSIEQTMWILLDCQSSAHIALEGSALSESNGEGVMETNFRLPRDTFETAVSIACSIADSWLRKGIAVGMALNQQPEYLLNPGHGTRQITEIIETLTYVKASSPYPVSQMLRNLSGRINSGQVCYLVTTNPSADLIQACHEALNRRIDLRIVTINKLGYENKKITRNNGIGWMPGRSLEFNYGDDLTRLTEIL